MSYDLAAENMDLMEPRVGAVGHTHLALWFHRDGGPGEPEGEIAKAGLELDLSEGQWLVNPGGVGQPRDRDPRAAWLLLDTEGWSAEWRRVEYPIDAAASAILEAGLPEGPRRPAPPRTMRFLRPTIALLTLAVRTRRGLRLR